nr:SHOCT domain-containing protein [Flavobacteriales bacterium]
NDIEFYAWINEEENIKMLEKHLEENKKKPEGNPISNLDELRKLSDLFKDGVITQQEFENKKAKLLV